MEKELTNKERFLAGHTFSITDNKKPITFRYDNETGNLIAFLPVVVDVHNYAGGGIIGMFDNLNFEVKDDK